MVKLSLKKKKLKKAEKHRSCGVSLKTSTVKCPMAPENGHWSCDVTCGVRFLAVARPFYPTVYVKNHNGCFKNVILCYCICHN